MCFSAEASLAIGTALLPAGAYCVRQALNKDDTHLFLAIIPIIFGLQQISEGVVWLALIGSHTFLLKMSTLAFLGFAFVFWPFWVPFCASVIEKRPLMKRLLKLQASAGLCFGLYLYIPLILQPSEWVSTRISYHSIQYDFTTLPTFHMIPGVIWQTFYIFGVTEPFLVTNRNTRLRYFGVMIGVAAILSHIAFWYAFVSVWCIFAAVLSAYLVYFFQRLLPVTQSTLFIKPVESSTASRLKVSTTIKIRIDLPSISES